MGDESKVQGHIRNALGRKMTPTSAIKSLELIQRYAGNAKYKDDGVKYFEWAKIESALADLLWHFPDSQMREDVKHPMAAMATRHFTPDMPDTESCDPVDVFWKTREAKVIKTYFSDCMERMEKAAQRIVELEEKLSTNFYEESSSNKGTPKGMPF